MTCTRCENTGFLNIGQIPDAVLNWRVNVSMTRAEVKAIARLGSFVGNIESMIKRTSNLRKMWTG